MTTEEEIAELKKQLRTFKFIAASGLLVGLAMPFILGAAAPLSSTLSPRVVGDTIEARAILIKDPNGKIVAFLGSDRPEAGMLGFVDRSTQGDLPITIGYTPEHGAALLVTSRTRQGHFAVLAPSSGRPGDYEVGMVVSDRTSNMAWGVRQSAKGGIAELLKDRAGSIRSAAFVDPTGGFRAYVEKSAFQQITDLISWGALFRDLTRAK